MTNLDSIFRRRQWHPTPVLLAGKSHGWRSLVGSHPWGHQELDMTERLHFHFSLSCVGEGNGNPLQCSCLENPRNGGACWAAIYGVAQSWTWLKRLSSSSSYILRIKHGAWYTTVFCKYFQNIQIDWMLSFKTLHLGWSSKARTRDPEPPHSAVLFLLVPWFGKYFLNNKLI